MSLIVTPLALPELLLLEPEVHRDARGSFVETFNARTFRAATGVDAVFVQDNQVRSVRGVLRGLHVQTPAGQGKLVRVTAGRVFDVAVDLRRGSPRFGRWAGQVLEADRLTQLWVPPGFAHGYLVLSDEAEVCYKVTAHRVPADERVLRWDDPDVAVAWPLEGPPRLSARDAAGDGLAEASTWGLSRD